MTTLTTTQALPAFAESLLVDVTPEALEQRKFAIEEAQAIVAVTTEQEQQDCLAAASLAKSLIKQMEETHKEVKAPILVAGRKIDAAKNGYSGGLELEVARLERILGDYEARKRQAIAEQQAALKNASTGLETLEELRQQHTQQMALVPAKTKGQVVREFWDYTVDDLRQFANAYPELVNIEVRRADTLATIGAQKGEPHLAGLRIFKSTRVTAKS